jgi:uncharacterized repeat protein (TIGR01451 family)
MRIFISILLLFGNSLVFGSTLTYSYDVAGRLVNLNYGANTNVTLTYDDNGNLLGQSAFVSANPDLAIAQFTTPDPVAVGALLHYTVMVFNNSTASATSVNVTNTLPANVALVTNAVTLGSVAGTGNLLSWNVGTLAGTAAASLTFDVRPNATGGLTNIAVVTAASTDPGADNNTNVLITLVVPRPGATTTRSGGNILINWPIAGGTGFSVEYSDSLSPPIDWKPLGVTPNITGDSLSAEDNLTGTNRFYRLVSP